MNAILLYLKEFFQRLATESPKFFKTLRIISLIVALLLSALLIFDTFYPIGLDTIIGGEITWRNVLGKITTGIAVVFGFSFLPVVDPSKLKSNGKH